MHRSFEFGLAAAVVLGLIGVGAMARAESPMAVDRSVLPWVEIASIAIDEGNAGLTPFTVNLRLHGAMSPIMVNVIATPGTASEGDYVFTPTILTLPPDGSAVTVNGSIAGDTAPEGDESFYLTAVAVAGDGGTLPLTYSAGGSVLIKDDDQATASRLHVEGATVLEGDQWMGAVEARVVLEPAATSTVTVAYETRDGTAIAGADYVSLAGILTFAPGEVEKTVIINILGDSTAEGDETFTVMLSAPSMALLGTAVATIVIVDDDGVVGPVDAQAPPSAMDAGSEASAKVVAGPDAGAPSLAPEVGSAAAPGANSDAAGEPGPDRAPRLASGCACSTSSPRRPGWPALFLPVAVAARRRRGHAS
jgi:hypothetical protein